MTFIYCRRYNCFLCHVDSTVFLKCKGKNKFCNKSKRWWYLAIINDKNVN